MPVPVVSGDRLIKKARKRTGLNDFGDFKEEIFYRLCLSINEEANLDAFGGLMIQEKLLSQLENRLWAQHWFKKYPEILDQPLKPVILITGLQRTGTTKMQRLLGRSENVRSLWSWEALYPAPIKSETEKRVRIQRTKRNEKAVRWISPVFQRIHPIHYDRPEEDVLLLDNSFVSSTFEAIMHVPSYARSITAEDNVDAYTYERKLLLLLQWQSNGDYWVLKSPHHLEHLEGFQKVLNPSKIIWMHRNPEECIPSFLNMLFHSQQMFCKDVSREALSNHWLEKISRMVRHGMEFRSLNRQRFHDVVYQDFVGNEKQAIAGLDLPFDVTPAHEEYVSKHQYRSSDWNIDPEYFHSVDTLQIVK